LGRAAESVGLAARIRTIATPEEASGEPGVVEVIDGACIDMAAHRWGRLDPAYGEAAVRWTKEAGALALAGRIDAMVSAPLNKEAMHEAGYAYEGQTEILGELTHSKPAMVMVVDRMRLMLFTNHMAMRQVCDYVRQDRVLERLVPPMRCAIWGSHAEHRDRRAEPHASETVCRARGTGRDRAGVAAARPAASTRMGRFPPTRCFSRRGTGSTTSRSRSTTIRG
jgi:4-hydroxythreonine-4-phosphate dehydrogenase